MKTRIISGIVMAIIVAAVLALGLLVNPLFITVFVAVVAAIGTYELVHNAAGIKSKAAFGGACVFAFLNIFALDTSFKDFIVENLVVRKCPDSAQRVESFLHHWELAVTGLCVLFFLYCVVMVLKNHKDFGLAQIAALCGLPIPLTFAFACLSNVINLENGLYYLLMLLNFSSICDMGAYFVGVTMGKHKLCPEISPKKTVEGAIGGIVSSLVFTVIFVLSFGMTEKLVTSLIFTIPLCIVGMLGDLFASSIKRSVGLKDYGALIPGHGGVLDRVDSILLISPVLYLCVSFGVL